MANKLTVLQAKISAKSKALRNEDPKVVEQAKAEIEQLRRLYEIERKNRDIVIKPATKGLTFEAIRMKENGGTSID